MNVDKFMGKGICGLANVGNTCYINTTLQCLGHCTHFLEYVLNGEYKQETGSLLTELREIFKELWVNDNGVIPNRFLKYLHQHVRGINIMEQNDIQEFLTLFVDKLNACIAIRVTPEMALSRTQYADSQYDKLRHKIDRAWFNSVGIEYSPLVDFFYGQSIVQVICGHCRKIHHTYEPFSILLLPLPGNSDGTDIIACLNHYILEETLNDHTHRGDDWKCDGCKQSVKSIKTTKFWRLPRILTICLKRFTHDLRKNNTYVKAPTQLDLSKYIIGPETTNTNNMYQLCSIACHAGSHNNGHYYALCRNPDSNWYMIDDTIITGFKDKYETPPTSYMLFYESHRS